MSEPASEHDIRCVCARQPILAKYGFDRATRAVFIHIKRRKQDVILCEVVVQAAVGSHVRLHCPQCLRWLTIAIRTERFQVREEDLPSDIAV